jgi:dTDP-glucose 4,6-dehydratase
MQGNHLGRVVVTGGAGFIGSNFVRLLFELGYQQVCVADALTYAGNRESLRDLESLPGFTFVHANICDPAAMHEVVQHADAVVNFAAESHVDRSLLDAAEFVRTNVVGTHVLLEAARASGVRRFVQVSTDEVYGDVETGLSTEGDRLHPRSPYSASKAGAEMLAIAYAETYGMPIMITRGSNTYGPYQFPEKFIPLMITNTMHNEPLPIYGDGQQIRDWIHVRDHCQGIAAVLHEGVPGGIYNIGGGDLRRNIDVVTSILREMNGDPALIQHVTDRTGHDRRYALDSSKLRGLGWAPAMTLERGLTETIDWYWERRDWWEPLKQASFAAYYERNYKQRVRWQAEATATLEGHGE